MTPLLRRCSPSFRRRFPSGAPFLPGWKSAESDSFLRPDRSIFRKRIERRDRWRKPEPVSRENLIGARGDEHREHSSRVPSRAVPSPRRRQLAGCASRKIVRNDLPERTEANEVRGGELRRVAKRSASTKVTHFSYPGYSADPPLGSVLPPIHFSKP
jgi:hypothetical protein